MREIVKECRFLLPSVADMGKWSVIACDQFTSQPEYWERLEKYVGGEPSALELIFPEVYLSGDNSARIERIDAAMERYLDGGVFAEREGLILVERTLRGGKKRVGLMLCVDLDAYEYTENNAAPIKATERTVVERLPVRIDIRRNAPIELPHIMLLADDAERSVIEPIYERRDTLELLYDFDLNMDGGHLRGYAVDDAAAVLGAIGALLDQEKQTAKYGRNAGMLFAVGDGNHSLATAKECWEEIKRTSGVTESPSRYALCELVNLYDESLVFEPIHRTVVGADMSFIDGMRRALSGDAEIKVYYKGEYFSVRVPSNPSDAIKDIQDYIDSCGGLTVDYIHGDGYLVDICDREGCIGIFMPTLAKEGLFDYAVRRGVLPRKSFSMGDAEDKRYYLEARKIK